MSIHVQSVSAMLLGVTVMALTTYLIRILPIGLFRKEIKSKWWKNFLYYVPYAVLSALTFPAIFYASGHPVASLLGTAVALILAYFDLGLVIVAMGAVAGALIVLLC